jgi:hypothetical protein
MVSNWPDGWRTAVLNDAGLPVSDFTLKTLQAWSDSTPILPYTNNPLGMPYVKGRTSQLMRTGYAMFPQMSDMRLAFTAFVNSPAGSDVHDALALGEKYSDAWRAIHALPWPASTTETDWPSAILDLTSESYREGAQSVSSPADRKTSGTIGDQTAFGQVTGGSTRNASAVVTSLQQATSAFNQNMRR